MPSNKIRQTSPDKVNGKLVKYRIGDCLAIRFLDGKYIGAIVSEKFNAFYDLTLTDFLLDTSPSIRDFENGRFFGTRFGSTEEIEYATDRCMVKCKYVDNNADFILAGSLTLIPQIIKGSYHYHDTEIELRLYYMQELPIRTEKSRNAEKFPDLGFVSKHLIDVKNIMPGNPLSQTK
ncbi:MAG TPA: hypothetical protein VL727_00640 [Puia sp.]|nr:hypothetical protein [Puia sp.]